MQPVFCTVHRTAHRSSFALRTRFPCYHSRIRNINGFMAGIIKRVRLDGPDRGAGKVGG